MILTFSAYIPIMYRARPITGQIYFLMDQEVWILPPARMFWDF